jgi:hypothetical protein
MRYACLALFLGYSTAEEHGRSIKSGLQWKVHSALSQQNKQVTNARVDLLLHDQEQHSDTDQEGKSANCVEIEGEAAAMRLFVQTNDSCTAYPANGVACIKQVQEVVQSLRASHCRCRFSTYIGPNLWNTRPLAAFIKTFLLTQTHGVLYIYSSFPQNGKASERNRSIFENTHLKGCALLTPAQKSRVQVRDAAEMLNSVQGLRWCNTAQCEVRASVSAQCCLIIELPGLIMRIRTSIAIRSLSLSLSLSLSHPKALSPMLSH